MDSERKIWNKEIENQFSKSLRAMLNSAYDGFLTSYESPIGITTPRLILAGIYLGKNRQEEEPFLFSLYNAVGEKETTKMEARLNQHGLDGEEFLGIKIEADLGVSDFARQIIEKAVDKKPPSRELVSPIDVLVTLAEKLPTTLDAQFDCSVLLPRDRFFPSELISWLKSAASEQEIPRDLQNRLKALPANHEARRHSSGRLATGSSALPGRSTADWQLFLRNQYGSDFDTDAASLVQEASIAPMSQIPSRGEFPLLNTRDFLSPLTNRGPLSGLKLGSHAGGYSGQPPWYEEAAEDQAILTTGTPLGNARLSFDCHECLKAAASLARTTPLHPKVTPWHIAIALVSSKSTGISWQLTAQQSSLDEAAKRLLTNMRLKAPSLFKERKWVNLLDVELSGFIPSESTKLGDKTATLSNTSSHREESTFLQIDLESFNQIDNFWDRAAIRPGNALSEALIHLCIRKKYLPPATTPGQLLLGLLQRGQNMADNTPDKDLTLEVLLFRRLSLHGQKMADLWNRDGVKYAEASESPEPNPNLSAIFKLAAKLEEACSPESVYVAPRHLIAAIVHLWRQSDITDVVEIRPLRLEDLEVSLREHIPVFQDQDHQEIWDSFFETGKLPSLTTPADMPPDSDPSFLVGTNSDFSRDSTSEQIDSDTKKLARAIASTFKSPNNGDFCFGLFGPWGRGKTTLIREVADELRDDHVAVTFNSWKYQTRPEVWVWLYETIKAHASGTDLLNRLRIGIQSNLRRDQGFGFLLAGFLLLFAAIPKGQLTGWLIPLDNLAAILALAALVFYGYRLWNSFGTLLRDYLKMPNHGRHLGLQSAIGDDLKHLLATWTGVGRSTSSNPANENSAPPFLPVSKYYYLKEMICWHWPFAIGVGLVVTSLVWLLIRVWEPANWQLRILLIGVAAMFLLGFVAVLLPPKRVKQILLIVDDLDRCPPDEMLNVIESLRVFLDDLAISSHLKIAMLLDRAILAHAICSKYQKLIQTNTLTADRLNPKQARFTRDGIVAEQIEKYFILSFDMPPLASASSWKIASKIVGYTEPDEPISPAGSENSSEQGSYAAANEQSSSPNTAVAAEERAQSAIAISTDYPTQDFPSTPTPESLDPLSPVEEVHLSDGEKKAMVDLLHSLLTTDPAHATPRRMRMIKMRYFLARQILWEQGHQFNPEDLLKHFSGLWIARKLEPKLAEVVGMVTGKTPEQ